MVFLLKNNSQLRNGKPKWFRQRTSALLLSDFDAARISYGLKGSAGIRPCLYCINVLKKDSGLVLPGGNFTDILESDTSKFIQATDAGLFHAADQLQHEVNAGRTKEQINSLEKAVGINYMPTGLLFDADARGRLKPMDFCCDGMHCYLSNGCASWECGLFLAAIQKARGWTPETLLDACTRSGWMRPNTTAVATASFVKSLLYSPLFSDSIYKGKAEQVEALVPLLRYYACNLLGSCEGLRDQLSSFNCLADCVSEMRRLKFCDKQIQAEDVATFDALQKRHQEMFTKAYAAFDCKPKHHHRFHLGESFVKLAAALRCEPMESKHRSYKSGLCEGMTSSVNQERSFQHSILCRMLTDQTSRLVNCKTLSKQSFAGPTVKAPEIWRHGSRDDDLQVVKSNLTLFIYITPQIYNGIIFWCCLKIGDIFLLVLKVRRILPLKFKYMTCQVLTSRYFSPRSETNNIKQLQRTSRLVYIHPLTAERPPILY